MDPLRLLSRSTKFAKKPSSTATKVQTPSAGPASNPQLFDHNHASQTVNRKRKRGSDVAAASLDFFGGGSVAQHGKKNADDQDKSEDELEQDVQTVAPVTLSSEECKQLLGRHKVKITLFDQRTADDAPSKKKKKDKKEKTEKKESKGEHRTPLYPVPVTDFGSLASRYGVSKTLVRNIKDQGYNTTTEVQLGALPLLLGSRAAVTGQESEEQGPALNVDLLSVAPTGSGKTLAFMIPLIHAISVSRRTQTQSGPKAIVLAPTKELASQIANEGRKLALNTGIRITYVRKGMHLGSESTTGVPGSEKEVPPVKADILVSTPAALKNAIGDAGKSAEALSNISYLVLDEADVLLDPLFREQTLGVWNALQSPTLRLGFWSATMGSNIEEMVKTTIKERADRLSETSADPVQIAPLVRLVVGLKDSAVPNIDHRLIYAATEQGKLMGLRELLHPTRSGDDKQPIVRAPFLVFTQTIERAVALHSELLYDIPVEAGGISRIAVLHSDLSDTARDHVMTRFRKGEVWVLITTDLLSRGVDFRGVNAVVNYDAPTSAAAYVHRVGRTGRAGREGGVALTYYTDDDVSSIKTVANIIVASQKQRGAAGGSTNVQQWLLDALPTPSKRDKQQLKKRGVETRRSASGKDPKTGKPQARISTKSGYIRKMETNRRGAVQATKSQQRQQEVDAASDSGESFGGFDE